jgi:uncharacterized protein (DUF2147 family)
MNRLFALHFAIAVTIVTGSAAVNAGTILDRFIADGRAYWKSEGCKLTHNKLSCRKHSIALQRSKELSLFETTGAKSALVKGPERSAPLAAVSSASPIAGPSASPIGNWIADEDRKIAIHQCGAALCGEISSVTQSNITDQNNPDPNRRTRPLVGVPVLIGMMLKEPNLWEGRLYNTRDGRSYSGRMSLRGGNLLQVEGEAPHSLLVQDWIRDIP